MQDMNGRSTPMGYPETYRRDVKMGWLAAFGTGGYPDGMCICLKCVLTGEEPPLLEELGINFAHIKTKVNQCGFLV
jgi:hypothetical protein